ncbi:MAG: hypothetical protein A7315_04160 [Candidatus Altiarchaeales archaeon WOR_SM1_79]|nr:MAG: hypothetical protein A7315_04160 [Candidatus Altiarchaeales archaeon WOR_SM1_79]
MTEKSIALGVCGSVAAIEAPKIAREFRRRGVEVYGVMSPAAQKIIHPDVLQWASEHGVVTELTGNVEHVKLLGVDGICDLLLICPATANTISKIACGIDDTPVTTMASTAIGSKRRVVVAPAMHASMYENPFVAENIEKLKSRGVRVIEPRFEGNKAKLAPVDEIVTEVVEMLDK